MPGRISRRSIAAYIASGLIEGKDKKALLQELAGFLVDSKRTKELDMIISDIEFQLSDNGIVQTIVTSAADLGAETKKAIQSFVKQKTKATQVSLSSIVDPSVIGGIKIAVPGYELDQTIAHQLTVLKTRFKKA
jgi:F0F1-type ATP synthase delta subunit